MKYFRRPVVILSLLMSIGTVVSPKFCEKHLVNDFCWIEENSPKGGPDIVED